MTDNCPACCASPVEPAASRADGDQITDRYRCPRCGHTWVTRRSAAAYQDHNPAAEDVA